MPPLSTTNAAPAPPSRATEPRYRNQAAQRVLRVLSAFAGPERDLGVTELAQRLGMNKNMVHRALTTLAAGRLLSAILYGLSPRDPVTYATAILLMALVALLACWSPASRAIHIDPASTLREE